MSGFNSSECSTTAQTLTENDPTTNPTPDGAGSLTTSSSSTVSISHDLASAPVRSAPTQAAVDIMATARGYIVPMGRTKVVQPLDIGIVRDPCAR
jgi:hypothetical protein